MELLNAERVVEADVEVAQVECVAGGVGGGPSLHGCIASPSTCACLIGIVRCFCLIFLTVDLFG